MKRIAGLILAVSFALSLFALNVAAPATAEVADADRAIIQSLIDGQIDAFRRDDGQAAYDFASPTIHSIFPSADIFMEMVRTGYLPVYRPQSFTFGPLIDTAAGPVQRVFITGPDGQNYVAEYALQRQPDGTWKINGCTLIKDTSPTI